MSPSSTSKDLGAAPAGLGLELIASEGLKGLSLRSIARLTGSGLGRINYQFGGKDGFVRHLVGELMQRQSQVHSEWIRRVESLDIHDHEVVSSIIAAFLDDLASRHRSFSIALCEFTLEAARSPTEPALQEVRKLVEAQVEFWRRILREHRVGEHLAHSIASYVREELPFCVCLLHEPDYRMLRAAVIARISSGFRQCHGEGFLVGFENLLARMRDPAKAPFAGLSDASSRRGEIAAITAAVMRDEGVGKVTHRAIAERAGVSPSTVAHYFRTLDQLLRAGVEAAYLHLPDPRLPDALNRRQDRMSVIGMTHVMVLAATRDSSLLPYAREMRSRMGERGSKALAAGMGEGTEADAASVHAMMMIVIGHGIAVAISGEYRDNTQGAAVAYGTNLARRLRGA